MVGDNRNNCTAFGYGVQALEGSIIDHGVKLVLVDSIAALARSEFTRDRTVDRQQVLGKQSL